MSWIPGITDRTFENPTHRNAEDLNRIGSNMQTLQNLLIECGFQELIYPISDWIGTETSNTNADIPSNKDLQKILNEINILRQMFAVLPTTPPTPNVPLTIYWKINDIEQILEDLHFLIIGMMSIWKYSGEFHSGEYNFYATKEAFRIPKKFITADGQNLITSDGKQFIV